MSKPILFALLTVFTLGVISFFVIPDRIDQTSTADTKQQAKISYHVPDRPAFDLNKLPRNIYKTICQLGYPMYVSKWDLDDTRFLYFKGPFKDYSKENNPTFPYIYRAIKSLNAEDVSTTLYLDSLDNYQDGIAPSERAQFLIPRFRAVPDRLDKLKKLLGKWDVEHMKSDPERLRIIYDKKMCVGDKLIIGAYFDIVDNKVVNTSGITKREKLEWVMANRKKPKPDKKPLPYTENIPAEGTAKHAVTQLVLLREAGKKSEALALIAKAQESEFFRNELTRQVDPTTSIDLNRFTYQATKYTRDSANISVIYYLKNGTLIDTKYTAVLEDGHWRIKY